MTEKQKEQWAAAGVFALLALLILWALFHAFGGRVGSSTVNNAAPDNGGVKVYQSPYDPALTQGDGCCGGCGGGGGGCPATSTTNTLNTMIGLATDAANHIYAAGNATLDAITAYGQMGDPLLYATRG
jgi:hypothetical protein